MSKEPINGAFTKWAIGILQAAIVVALTWMAKETSENGKKMAALTEQVRLLENQVFRLQVLDDRRAERYEMQAPSEYRPLPRQRPQ